MLRWYRSVCGNDSALTDAECGCPTRKGYRRAVRPSSRGIRTRPPRLHRPRGVSPGFDGDAEAAQRPRDAHKPRGALREAAQAAARRAAAGVGPAAAARQGGCRCASQGGALRAVRPARAGSGHVDELRPRAGRLRLAPRALSPHMPDHPMPRGPAARQARRRIGASTSVVARRLRALAALRRRCAPRSPRRWRRAPGCAAGCSS